MLKWDRSWNFNSEDRRTIEDIRQRRAGSSGRTQGGEYDTTHVRHRETLRFPPGSAIPNFFHPVVLFCPTPAWLGQGGATPLHRLVIAISVFCLCCGRLRSSMCYYFRIVTVDGKVSCRYCIVAVSVFSSIISLRVCCGCICEWTIFIFKVFTSVTYGLFLFDNFFIRIRSEFSYDLDMALGGIFRRRKKSTGDGVGISSIFSAPSRINTIESKRRTFRSMYVEILSIPNLSVIF